jgi:hypothetical protein
MAPLQTYPGGYGDDSKVVMLRIDPDFDIDTKDLDTIEKKKFSGIAEYNAITAGRGYGPMDEIQIKAIIDEHFGIKDKDVESRKEYKVNRFRPNTSSNKISAGETKIDPAFNL